MAKELGVLIIHGMGKQTDDEFKRKAASLMKELQNGVADPDEWQTVCWKHVYWGDVLQKKEEELFKNLFPERSLLFKLFRLRFYIRKLRMFVIHYLGDAVAYQKRPKQTSDIYSQIHQKVHDAIAKLRSELGNKDKALVVIAHSLGSVIMSDYIWDRQHGYPLNDVTGNPLPFTTSFEKMETLTLFVTFGSNIPLFSLAHDPVKSIDFPPEKLPHELKGVAKWLNFYSPNDVLGHPLQPLYEDQQANGEPANNISIDDRKINAGNLLTFWNPFSHAGYWKDNDFTKPVANALKEVLKVIFQEMEQKGNTSTLHGARAASNTENADYRTKVEP